MMADSVALLEPSDAAATVEGLVQKPAAAGFVGGMMAVSLGGNQEVTLVAAIVRRAESRSVSGISSFVPTPMIGLTASGGAKSAVGDDSAGGLVESLSSIRRGRSETRYWDLTPQWDGFPISKNFVGTMAVVLLDPGGQQGGIGSAELLDPDGHGLAWPASFQLKLRSSCKMSLAMKMMEVVAQKCVSGEVPLPDDMEYVVGCTMKKNMVGGDLFPDPIMD